MKKKSEHGSENIDILLIEDNPYDAELTQRAFKKNHLLNNLVWIKDGVAAIEYIFGATSEPEPLPIPFPTLILLDLKLPKVDGHEVLRRLKRDSRTRLIPVVVLTSSRQEMDIMDAYQLGVNSYIVKPVDFDGFTAAIQQLGLYWLLLNQAPGKDSAVEATKHPQSQ
jgi:two-component system, response regulator